MKQTAYENLAVGIAATSDGTLNWPGVVTNEDTWADNGVYAGGEFAYTSQTGLHYVQLDLGAVYTVDQVKVWHYARDGRTYHNTRTQVSADGVAWTTVFDSAVSGEYAETAAGKTHSFTAQGVRYVRDWLNGNTVNAGDHWVEIEVWGTRTTAYVGGHYEKDLNSGVVTKYYHFGGSRVAMQRGGVVYYLLDDHLGSTSLTVDSSGNKVAELRYKAYGETRYSGPPQGTPTDYRFTGQRREGYINLYIMGARWYDPYISRFLSPDTLVPDPANPQSLNRFAYVLGNPLRYTDPSGYDPLDAEWEQAFYDEHGYWPSDLDRFYRLYSIAYAGPVSGSWSWTQEDWTYLSEHHNRVLEDISQRSSLRDFSAAIGRISDWYNEGEEAQFVSGLALLFAGWPYDPTGDNIIPVSFPSYKPIDFCQGAPDCTMRYYVNHGMESFSGQYYYRDIENTHHWAGHLITAYHMGRGKNLLLVRLREALQSDPDRNADIAMGDVAGMHAYALRRGYVTIADFAAYVFQSLMAR